MTPQMTLSDVLIYTNFVSYTKLLKRLYDVTFMFWMQGIFETSMNVCT